VSSVRYELGFYIPGDDILHSHRRENRKSYIVAEIFVAVPKADDVVTILDVSQQYGSLGPVTGIASHFNSLMN
jgi:hypothetical protein